ncbi:DUF3157 family protein [Seonamhaeicola sp. ML3]|uniref:DUF3157 family protein n=1 Tax=Seonamhaeicola sp. ML3 TaxID=2937786 RepID=UPI00200C0953|nr:DUF3157 family protein [Seonamhaeicola sp. ML3]
MKSIVYALVFLFSFVSFSQDNHIVKTEDGRRVLLKADFTWEYIDLVKPEPTKQKEKEIEKPISSNENSCSLSANYTEPELNKKVQNQLKKGRATIAHVKKKVAKDFNCDVKDVILLLASETKEKGTYKFCVNGTKTVYKRTGHNIAKKLKLF